MTINETEVRTGLDRGTIRYYESEGLLKPAREPNGYRNYSDGDVEKLLKVKLLRALNFSVEDIRAMDEDGEDFPDRLRARSRALEAVREDIEDARRVIDRMLEDGASYESLDTGAYLAALESAPPELPAREEPGEDGNGTNEDGPEEHPDTGPAPWRRYFARLADTWLLETVYIFITARLLSIPYGRSSWDSVLVDVFIIAATVLAEPLLLWLTGATPGKWIMGLRVTDGEGRRLSLGAAFWRTWGVMFFGEGLRVPIISLWRRIASFKACRRGDELPWESRSRVVKARFSALQCLALAGFFALNLALIVHIMTSAEMPVNRGDVTPEQLAENVNRYFKYNLDGNSRWELESDGTWKYVYEPVPGEILSNTADPFTGAAPPERVELTVSGGTVTGLRWVQTLESDDGFGATGTITRLSRALMFSLVGTDRSLGYHDLRDLEKRGEAFTDLTATYGCWTVTRVVTTGDGASFFPDGNLYYLFDDREQTYGLELTVTRTGE